MRMMQEPIEQCGDRGGVTQQLAPVVDRSVDVSSVDARS
jgi:hypothetical protein